MANATMEQLVECLFSDQMQEAEDAALALFLLWNLDALTGKRLQDIAEILGAPLLTASDDDMRAYIRGVIAAKNSDGDVRSLLAVLRLILNQETATITEAYPCELYLFAQADPTATIAGICLLYMRQAVTAGVKINGLIVAIPGAFRLDYSKLDGPDKLAKIYT
jgi:hypothetical protein